MLEHMIHKTPGAGDGSPVLVLLHGRGSDMGDLQGLSRVLPPGGTLVTPQAPHPGAPWGYGPGWAWYRYLGGDQADKASLDASLMDLEGFLDTLDERVGFRVGPLVLGGFSQGGTTSLAFGITRPGRVSGVVVLSGFLASEESLQADPAKLGETPVFWAHGTQDPAVPFSLAVEGRRRLQAAGVQAHARDYTMGHWVTPEEMKDLQNWLEARVEGWGSPSARSLSE
jgi:phospholipase/carboxylesterase